MVLLITTMENSINLLKVTLSDKKGEVEEERKSMIEFNILGGDIEMVLNWVE